MKSEQRALQIWSVLALAADTQHILSYKTLEKLTGLPSRSFAEHFGRVAQHCKRNGLPPLTAIVVSEETGMPGEGYPRSEDLQILRDQARVFVFDWLSRGAPTEEELSEKWRE